MYKYHEDPGHGWIEVPMKELRRLKIADRISPFSYRAGGIAYLEEDCDASVWVNAKTAAGEDIKTERVHTNHDSFVRNLPSYENPIR